jgi:hypothetical protein
VLGALDAVLLPQLRPDARNVRGGRGRGGRRGVTEPDAAAGEPGLPAWLTASPLPTGDEQLVERSRQVLRRALRSHDK